MRTGGNSDDDDENDDENEGGCEVGCAGLDLLLLLLAVILGIDFVNTVTGIIDFYLFTSLLLYYNNNNNNNNTLIFNYYFKFVLNK
jgi:hypothetical protein